MAVEDRMKKFITVLALASFALVAVAASNQHLAYGEMSADKESIRESKPNYSPYAGRGYPTKVFFGDTHLHTSFSFDAGAFGNRLKPEQAFRFAKGEEVISSSGLPVKLVRPLDFLVVSDHSEQAGFFDMIYKGDPLVMKNEIGRRWHKEVNAGGERAVNATLEIIDLFSKGQVPQDLLITDRKQIKSVWEKSVRAAEEANDPGTFTAFIGYEWSALLPPGDNLHRVVIFRDDADKAMQVIPFSSMDSLDPEDLWEAMAAYEEKTGGDVLAIPHNGNLSNGLMFALSRLNGDPLTKEYATARARWEPIYEVTQIKGDGESHPLLSPNDEFADYENWDLGNLNLSVAKTPEMLEYEYARSGLKLGLKMEEKLGVNPFKFGMIGSTDSHTSLATAREENFFGKHSGAEPDAKRSDHIFIESEHDRLFGWQQVASGYAAVWAHENTREAIFDAMERREVYATTGTRLFVRFFGGWNFTKDDLSSRRIAEIGYQKGIPMGGDLSQAPDGKAPSFLVAALKDPIGANLDRIQIVKGWLSSSGQLKEKVYDVAVSDGRKPGPDGKIPHVGSTVNEKDATWTNTIGDPELIAVWTDPDFDPKQRAFYYARVIEIPTPRWTAYDAKRFGTVMPPEVPMSIQDRAYTSPIWYTP